MPIRLAETLNPELCTLVATFYIPEPFLAEIDSYTNGVPSFPVCFETLEEVILFLL